MSNMASAPSTTDRRPYWAIQLDSPPKRNLNAPRPRDPPGYTASSSSKVNHLFPSICHDCELSLALASSLQTFPHSQATHQCRNRYLEDQKVLGARHSASEAATNECHHDVHVWQLAPNIQHYDGVYAIQEPHYRLGADKSGFHEV